MEENKLSKDDVIVKLISMLLQIDFGTQELISKLSEGNLVVPSFDLGSQSAGIKLLFREIVLDHVDMKELMDKASNLLGEHYKNMDELKEKAKKELEGNNQITG